MMGFFNRHPHQRTEKIGCPEAVRLAVRCAGSHRTDMTALEVDFLASKEVLEKAGVKFTQQMNLSSTRWVQTERAYDSTRVECFSSETGRRRLRGETLRGGLKATDSLTAAKLVAQAQRSDPPLDVSELVQLPDVAVQMQRFRKFEEAQTARPPYLGPVNAKECA